MMLRLCSSFMWVIWGFALGLSSCAEPPKTTLEEKPYFDLKGFLEIQIDALDGTEVRKLSKIQDQEETVNVSYDREDWEEEFEVFTQADINNPSSVDSYQTSESASSLSHELKPKAKSKVKYIKVYFAGDKVERIELRIAEDNLFYASETLGELVMNTSTNLIDHYSIETTQKIWFLDPNNMSIKGDIEQ
ncbi:hypothetical protein PBT90_19000 [Algoriphagus halophytocola]|uniref:hypothetical protein n=1 Tax=Algoriphagus halophytocola TaxID=2991499 RepID=UPI0022DDCFA2|nr:hypothetical protein [Algoriphagus sp. TR-M9]WBL42815.1 hypothetical protein PBT90_19000 [Algoriphagus sp. TR-M9]